MKKVINIGTDKDTRSQVFCNIEFNEKKKLSITGVIGPRSNGDAKSCGQINGSFNINKFANGWNDALLTMFLTVWDKYHLNDMQAGTIKQTAIIEQYKADFPDWRYEYTQACTILEDNDILIDDGYQYGSKWLSIEVPASVISFLEGLPETENTPAWV